MMIPALNLPAASDQSGLAGADSALADTATPGAEHPFAKLLSSQKTLHGAAHKAADKSVIAGASAAAHGKPPMLASSAAPFNPARTGALGAPDAPLTAERVDPALLATVNLPVEPVPADISTAAKTEDTKELATPASSDVGVLIDPALTQWAATLTRPAEPPAADTTPVALAPDATGKVQAVARAEGVPAGQAVEGKAQPPRGLTDLADPGKPPATDHDIKNAPAPRATTEERVASTERATTAERATSAERATFAEHATAAERAATAAQDAQTSGNTKPSNNTERAHALDVAAASVSAIAASAVGMPMAPATAPAFAQVQNGNATVTLDLPVPVAASEFRSALGVQVSVLARDGVQHAQLNLTPAEMGPVSIQIALEGTLARVDFGADMASTRQIIESGMPELAAALRDAGLTLSGGSVSQHSKGRSQGDAGGHGQSGADPQNRRGAEHEAVNVRRTGWRVPQGAVDLYA